VIVNQPVGAAIREQQAVIHGGVCAASRFTAAYPSSLSAQTFCKYDEHKMRAVPYQGRVTTMVAELNLGGQDASAGAESNSRDQDLHKCGVQPGVCADCQFYGYLRRNPNDPQDSDYKRLRLLAG